MKGKRKLIEVIDTVKTMAGENPCGWSDDTLYYIASGISVLIGEKTGAGLTTLQVAEYFGVTIRTIERWRKKFNDFPEPLDPYAKTLAFPTDKIVSWKIKHSELNDIF